MKKIILSIAVLASSVAVFADNSNQADNVTSSVRTEQTGYGKDKKKDKDGKTLKRRSADNENKKLGRRGRHDRMKAFDGINLTDDQKNRLASLRQTSKSERKADIKEGKKGMEQRMSARKAARQKYLAGVKQILTADQYQKFLENNFAMGGRDGRMKDKKGHDKKMRFSRGDKKQKS